MVVHHHSQMVGGVAVGLDDDLVVHLRGVNLHRPADEVAKNERALLRHGQANHVLLARVDAALRLGGSRWRQWPSYLGSCLAARWRSRTSSSRSFVQKHVVGVAAATS
jgi:hypothetical protein